jgi:hypothetical protein
VRGPWWTEIPGRLDVELESLRDVCSEVTIYRQDQRTGQLGLKFVLALGGEHYQLRAEFPPTYPFTRPVVYAEDNQFNWHQNPYGKNLCLLGRTAENWVLTQTLAGHLSEQMPKLIASNWTADPDTAADLEELQAEPFTAFLNYQRNSSMLLLQRVPRTDRDKGGFAATCVPFDGVFRGAVVGLADDLGRQILGLPNEATTAMEFTKQIKGNWFRMGSRPRTGKAAVFLEEIAADHPELRKRTWTRHRDHRFEIVGALVPEEEAWRTPGEAMVFICLQEQKTPSGKKFTVAEFIRTYRSDQATLSARVPETSGLETRRILLAGAGSIGSHCALEFARNGVGRINLVDGDVVEAGNSVRWALGLASAGLPKVTALQRHIAANHPFTQAAAWPVDVGSEAYTLDVEEQILEKVDMIFDATAERGISYLLSERARRVGVPYIHISGTQGNWGGVVLALRAESSAPCWVCVARHWTDGTLPRPSSGPESPVQPGGCASPTFTGAYMDSSEVALMGVRLATSLLASGYPPYDWDYGVVNLRNPDGGHIAPAWSTRILTRHPDCGNHPG